MPTKCGKINEPTGCANTLPALTTTAFVAKGHVMADAQGTVEYREIPGYPGYRVGSDGTVWGPRGLRRQHLDGSGYLRIQLKGRSRSVHQLVLEAFIGPRPPKFHCCHGDGVKTNNALANLRWGTASENTQDRVRHGTMVCGEKSPKALLTERQVLKIIEMAGVGFSTNELARIFAVTHSAICWIMSGRSWRHLPGERKSYDTGVNSQQLGAAIRARRLAAGLKQIHVSLAVAPTSGGYLSRVESAKAGISVRRLIKIADAIGCKAEDIFHDIGLEVPSLEACR